MNQSNAGLWGLLAAALGCMLLVAPVMLQGYSNQRAMLASGCVREGRSLTGRALYKCPGYSWRVAILDWEGPRK